MQPLNLITLRLCLAVAQRIERLLDGKDGRRFESYQPDYTLEALGFRHPGLLCFPAKLCGKAKTPPLLTGFFAVALDRAHAND